MLHLLGILLFTPTLVWGAMDFNGSVGTDAEAVAVEITATPFTVACLVNSDDDTAGQVVIGISDLVATATDSFRLIVRGAAGGDPVSAQNVDSGATVQSDTSSGYTAGSWHSVAAVFASTTSRSSYIDGGSKGTETTSNNPTGLAETVIGAVYTSGATPFNGRIAECGIWNVALTDDEVAVLGKRFAPSCVRRNALVAYYPMIRDTTTLKDRFSATANNLTLAGTTAVADHPRVIPCQ